MPGGQAVQTPAPAREYHPKGHCTEVADVDPAGHAYPAVQLPLQTTLVRPWVDPKVPAGQLLHTAAPAKL